MSVSGTSRASSAAPSDASGSAHSSRSSTPTVKIEVTQTQPDPKHVQIETPDRTPAGTPPPGESRLRQRFRSVRDELGKSMEDISVRIRNKGDGNYKVCFRRGRR